MADSVQTPPQAPETAAATALTVQGGIGPPREFDTTDKTDTSDVEVSDVENEQGSESVETPKLVTVAPDIVTRNSDTDDQGNSENDELSAKNESSSSDVTPRDDLMKITPYPEKKK